MGIELKLEFSHFGAIAAALEDAVNDALKTAAGGIETYAKLSIESSDKHGRLYKSGEITRNLGKRERAGLNYKSEVGGNIRLRTASGLLVREPSARGKRLKVVVGSKLHHASAPGEAPATDTGNLVNSIHVRKAGPFAYEVYSNSEYAAALEFGAPAKHIAARPFLKPAIEAERPAFLADMAKVFEK